VIARRGDCGAAPPWNARPVPTIASDRIARVYGAALAASAGAAAAALVAGRVLAHADGLDDDDLVARAVRMAARQAPAIALAAMEPEDREAVALARIVGLPARRVAAELGVDELEARRRMLRGLRALAARQAAAA
jgi:DNA-directed RNA polymerase specialized sigma24 family protein